MDYLAIGPVFATGSKENRRSGGGVGGRLRGPALADDIRAGAPAGGHRRYHARANAEAVLKAGADSVAVIGGLSVLPRESAKEFFRLMM